MQTKTSPSKTVHHPIGYNVHTQADRDKMLAAIGVDHIEHLLDAIPDSVRYKGKLPIQGPLSEWSLDTHLRHLAAKNQHARSAVCFLGGGMYDHHIPAVVDELSSRSEFATAYTPYQPDISQGLLQALFEYQELIATITGLPIVNGSCYDGATALADAARVACKYHQDRMGKSESPVILVSDGIWTSYKRVLTTYLSGGNATIKLIPTKPDTGETDLSQLESELGGDAVAACLVQSPNRYGILEPVEQVAALCAAAEVTSIASWYPIASGLLKPPGTLGMDIVTGEGQSLGIPMQAGGPGLGLFACKPDYQHLLPGRRIGQTKDDTGKSIYRIIDEKREQHVAREHATSNICSNQANNALRAAIYLSTLGRHGLQDLARLNALMAHKLAAQLSTIEGVRLSKTGQFFNEFAIDLPVSAKSVLNLVCKKGIFAGINISTADKQRLLIAVTETKTMENLRWLEYEIRTAIEATKEAS